MRILVERALSMKSRNMSLGEDALLSLIGKVVVCDKCNHIQVLSADSEVVFERKQALNLHRLNHGTIKFLLKTFDVNAEPFCVSMDCLMESSVFQKIMHFIVSYLIH